MKYCLLGLLLVFPGFVWSATFELEVPGYSSEVGEHKAEGTPKNVIVKAELNFLVSIF